MDRTFQGIDSGMFADALDTLGFDGAMWGLTPLFPGTRFSGKAATFKMIVARAGTFNVADIALGQVVEAAQRGEVIVIDLGGAPISVWGELAAMAAQAKGVAGLLAEGGVRDADIIRKLQFPTLARHITPVAGKTRLKLVSVNQEPVMCGGVPVRHGDFIFADDTGAVVVPQGMEEATFAEVEKIKKREDAFKEGLARGLSYLEAAKEMGLRQL